MGNGGLPDAQAFAQFADTEAGTGIGVAIMPFTAIRETQENGETMRVGQGFEGESEFLDIHISMIIDI